MSNSLSNEHLRERAGRAADFLRGVKLAGNRNSPEWHERVDDAIELMTDFFALRQISKDGEGAVVAPPHEYDYHWNIVADFHPDGKAEWLPRVWGKHQALHVSRVREAIATALQRAPECADVIVMLIWQNALNQNRHDFLMADKDRQLAEIAPVGNG